MTGPSVSEVGEAVCVGIDKVLDRFGPEGEKAGSSLLLNDRVGGGPESMAE